MYSNLLNLPKIELHCHLDGSVRPNTLKEFARKAGHIDQATLEQFDTLMKAPVSCQSLVEYIDCFKLPISFMQSEDQLERIAEELIEDVASQGVKYIEVRFAPHLHMEKGLNFDQIVSAVLRGLKKGEDQTGTMTGLILCCMRHLSPDKSIEVVTLGHKFLNKGVVAVDLAGDEHNFPPEIHKEAFDLAKEMGYHITIHAGETGIAQNVTTSITQLHAERIGHGLYIKDDAKAYQTVKDHEIALEMCPTSNIQTKAVNTYAEHPILSFLNNGIKATLNTDNMTVSDVNLTKELSYLEPFMTDFDIQYWTLYKNAVEASFTTQVQKEKLISYIPEAYRFI